MVTVFIGENGETFEILFETGVTVIEFSVQSESEQLISRAVSINSAFGTAGTTLAYTGARKRSR
jgi:hypothetical protein